MNLADRLRMHDPKAMADLYDLYGTMVFRIALRNVGNQSVAEDLTQETFLRIWNGARSFDDTRGSLGAWISVVARNTAIDYLRSPTARLSRTSVGLLQIERTRKSSAFEDWIPQFDRVRMLRKAFEPLTETQRQVLNLCYVEGMSHAEIARSLNRPLGTIKTWLRTALRLLQVNARQYSV